MERLLPIEVEEIIREALKNKNSVELKLESENLVVVEIQRRVRAKVLF